jgi:hypothetical protein
MTTSPTPNPKDLDAVEEFIRHTARTEQIRVTVHAQQEMVEEEVKLELVLQVLSSGTVLENYPDHQRGACCLVNGTTWNGRSLHVVCTTTSPVLIIITVYEPKLPKWVTPTQRRQV